MPATNDPSISDRLSQRRAALEQVVERLTRDAQQGNIPPNHAADRIADAYRRYRLETEPVVSASSTRITTEDIRHARRVLMQNNIDANGYPQWIEGTNTVRIPPNSRRMAVSSSIFDGFSAEYTQVSEETTAMPQTSQRSFIMDEQLRSMARMLGEEPRRRRQSSIPKRVAEDPLYKLQQVTIEMMQRCDPDLFEIEIGDMVQALFGNEYDETTDGWRGVVYGSARGTGGKLEVKTLDGERSFPVRLNNFIKVASAWPNERSKQPAITVMNAAQKTKEKFYDLFQIGLEIEGEFFCNYSGPEGMEERTKHYFRTGNGTIKHDGSLCRRKDGYLFELNSPIIKSVEDEKRFIEALRSISKKRDRPNGVFEVFSWVNETAGTHVHLDWNKRRIRKVFRAIGFHPRSKKDELKLSQYLRMFDSMEFEEFFFDRYFKTFHLKKFWTRLTNNYCRSFLTPTEKGVKPTPMNEVEQKKFDRGKYSWLNYECLSRDMGIEFRIFPYVTTVSGVREMISFIQHVMLEYFTNKVSAEDLKMIEAYYTGNLIPNEDKMSSHDVGALHKMYIEDRSHYRMSLDAIRLIKGMVEKYGLAKPTINNRSYNFNTKCLMDTNPYLATPRRTNARRIFGLDDEAMSPGGSTWTASYTTLNDTTNLFDEA